MHSYKNDTDPVPMETMYSDLEHVFMTGTLLIIMIFSLVGNIMVCVTVYRKRRLRTRTNAFIINLTVADLGVAILCMPFSLVTCLYHRWTFGDVMCHLNGFVNIVFTQTSLLTLTAIAIDKYYAIVWPLRRMMTKRRAAGLIAWTWIQPVMVALIPFTGITRYQFKLGTTQCGLEYPKTISQIIYGVGVSVIGYFVPLGIMGYVYSKIFHSAKRSARRISRVSINSTTSVNSFATHRKVAITVLILVILFFGCWTPYFTYVIIVISYPSLTSHQHVMSLGKASYWMAFLCSALNPYIYGARNPQFRKEFKLLLCCLCPCFAPRLKIRGCSTTSGSRGSWEVSDEYNRLRRGSTPWGTPFGTPVPCPKRESSFDLTAHLRNLAMKNNNLCEGYFNDSNHDNSIDNEDVGNHSNSFDKQTSKTDTAKRRQSSLKLRFQENLSFIDSPTDPSCNEESDSEHIDQQSSRHSYETPDNQVNVLSFCNDVTDSSALPYLASKRTVDVNKYKRRWIESTL